MTSKKIGDDVMSANCGVIAIFPTYDQFWAIQKPVPDTQSVKLRLSSTVTF